MRYKIILFSFLFVITCTKTFPAVFVVTSNADSGPGTLREALTLAAANGSTEKDFINFNLPDLSEAGRTITLVTQLPDMSSNLVIDGTTQPGVNFGVSDAKIELYYNYTPPFLGAPAIIFKAENLTNLTLTGLYLNAIIFDGQPSTFALTFTNVADLTITHCLLPGGNFEIDNSNSLSLKSNMIGYMPDGITGQATTFTIYNALNVTIGGNAAEGNFLNVYLKMVMDILDKDWTYLISNNKMGTDYTGISSNPSLFSQGRIDIESGHYNPPSTGRMRGTITDNMIENFATAALVVSGFGDVTIKGNSIQTDKTGKINFFQFSPGYVQNSSGWAPTAIALQVGVDAVVGGSAPGDANQIGYVSNAILEQLANQVVISQNSIFCLNRNYFNIHDFVTQAYTKPLPQVRIDNYTDKIISGTATPGARVELFYNASEGSECPYCGARYFFAFAIADSQGNWSYSGVIPANIVASAIFDNQTSHFTKPELDVSNLQVTQPKCGDNTGAIKGIKFYNAGGVKWIDNNGNTISQKLDIDNLPPGTYKLQIGTLPCGVETDWIEMIDNSIKVDASNVKIKHPSCGIGGAISGLVVTSYQNEIYTAKWVDKNNNPVGTSVDISNLVSGQYTLTVTGNVTGCKNTYGPVTLLNTTGPNIDQSNAIIQPTPCGQSTGSITNLAVTGTGTLKYTWRNSQQQTVSNSIDLLNQPAGIYKLQVTDDTQCGPIYSTDLQIPETNGIIIDESTAQTTIAKCGLSNGSITGIKVTGATNYTWAYGLNSKIITTSPDLLNMPPGDYVLTASNSFGCVKSSTTYHITQQASTLYPVYDWVIKFACFGQQNGSIKVSTDGLVKSARWVNSQGLTIGNASTLSASAAGTYQLFLTDANGCETFYSNYTLPSIPQLQITPASESITNEQCTLKNGSIKNIQVSGGTAPYTYSWADALQNPIASTLPLSNLGAGLYTLTVNDASGCGAVSATYTVLDQSSVITPPSVSNLDVCSAGEALLLVNNPSAAYKYRLYASNSSPAPIDEQVSGSFKIAAKNNTSFFISQVSGSCESARTEVKISVGLTSLDIANTFTPNGDGINDYWRIKGVENYPNALVRIFNRYGLQVFESKGYAKPFDGTYNGKQLPAGAYYFIINLNSECNILSGSLTIIK